MARHINEDSGRGSGRGRGRAGHSTALTKVCAISLKQSNNNNAYKNGNENGKSCNLLFVATV